ncbi:MAG: VWA-like domain-containing protein [Lachnospiraceae bacterium]|nr:VWA-like domain-containing protein [Lachnospiraceae bacterium]
MSKISLVINLRFLDQAISRLSPLALYGSDSFSTDGVNIGYDPIKLLKLYKKGRSYPVRAYLHMILHCVFRHFFVNTLVDRELWDLACDITVENIICDLKLASLFIPEKPLMKDEIYKMSYKIKYMTAEHIYAYLQSGDMDLADILALKNLFSVDDHEIWYSGGKLLSEEDVGEDSKDSENSEDYEDSKDSKDSKDSEDSDNSDNKKAIALGIVNYTGSDDADSDAARGNSEEDNTNYNDLLEDWKSVSERMQMELDAFTKDMGDKTGNLSQNLREVNREHYDYADFLRKFAVLGEVMKVNDDEFDYIFYTYGLDTYENMPLIEPLEYKEVKRIKEFVIAIDTSGSTSGDLVQHFLEKTYNILKQEESFFTKINLHIIQCDSEIKEHVKITCQEDFDKYLKTFKIIGLGGTDFRPVFEFVDDLIEKKEFYNLKGMIYFTDGYGIFPYKQPDYETAVVFVDDGYNKYDVPAWAIKLVLKPGDVEKL